MKKLLEIKNLKKNFGKKKIFSDLNFTVNEGECLAIMGPNGCGKTTLLDMICGLSNITGGKIMFSNRENFFQELGIQFQSGSYPYGIRVKDLIWLYFNIYNQKIDKTLKSQFNIANLEKQSVNSLSFGERKRLELFLLLSNKNKILILDEITSGMDIVMRLSIMQLLKKHLKKHRITMLYVSHNYNEVQALCNRVILIGKKGITLNRKIKESESIQKSIEKVLKAEYTKNNE